MAGNTRPMDGRVCVITGATSGIGRAAASELAALGARVVIVARDRGRGAAARDAIAGETGNHEVSLEVADLASQRQIRDLAVRLLASLPEIHVLVNNAGVTLAERRLTEDGLEETFAVNHLAPFLLTNLLLERLRASAPARVVTVASAAHRGAAIPFDDLNGERGFSGWRVYGWTKLANILFTVELARRLQGSRVTATCLHPGVVATGFAREGPLLIREFQRWVGRLLLLDPRQGADTLVWLASSPEVAGASGGYYAKRRLETPSRAARDAAAARRLWEVSARLTGLA